MLEKTIKSDVRVIKKGDPVLEDNAFMDIDELLDELDSVLLDERESDDTVIIAEESKITSSIRLTSPKRPSRKEKRSRKRTRRPHSVISISSDCSPKKCTKKYKPAQKRRKTFFNGCTEEVVELRSSPSDLSLSSLPSISPESSPIKKRSTRHSSPGSRHFFKYKTRRNRSSCSVRDSKTQPNTPKKESYWEQTDQCCTTERMRCRDVEPVHDNCDSYLDRYHRSPRRDLRQTIEQRQQTFYKRKLYRYMVKEQLEKCDELLAFHIKNPEKHPQYHDEWTRFWKRPYYDNQVTDNFIPEWIVYWTKRMVQLHDETIEAKKRIIRIQLSLPIDVSPARGPQTYYETSPTYHRMSEPSPPKHRSPVRKRTPPKYHTISTPSIFHRIPRSQDFESSELGTSLNHTRPLYDLPPSRWCDNILTIRDRWSPTFQYGKNSLELQDDRYPLTLRDETRSYTSRDERWRTIMQEDKHPIMSHTEIRPPSSGRGNKSTRSRYQIESTALKCDRKPSSLHKAKRLRTQDDRYKKGTMKCQEEKFPKKASIQAGILGPIKLEGQDNNNSSLSDDKPLTMSKDDIGLNLSDDICHNSKSNKKHIEITENKFEPVIIVPKAEVPLEISSTTISDDSKCVEYIPSLTKLESAALKAISETYIQLSECKTVEVKKEKESNGVNSIDKAALSRLLGAALVEQENVVIPKEELNKLVEYVVEMAEAEKCTSETGIPADSLENMTMGCLKVSAKKIMVSPTEQNQAAKENQKMSHAEDIEEGEIFSSPASQVSLSAHNLKTMELNFTSLPQDEQLRLFTHLKKLEEELFNAVLYHIRNPSCGGFVSEEVSNNLYTEKIKIVGNIASMIKPSLVSSPVSPPAASNNVTANQPKMNKSVIPTIAAPIKMVGNTTPEMKQEPSTTPASTNNVAGSESNQSPSTDLSRITILAVPKMADSKTACMNQSPVATPASTIDVASNKAPWMNQSPVSTLAATNKMPANISSGIKPSQSTPHNGTPIMASNNSPHIGELTLTTAPVLNMISDNKSSKMEQSNIIIPSSKNMAGNNSPEVKESTITKSAATKEVGLKQFPKTTFTASTKLDANKVLEMKPSPITESLAPNTRPPRYATLMKPAPGNDPIAFKKLADIKDLAMEQSPNMTLAVPDKFAGEKVSETKQEHNMLKNKVPTLSTEASKDCIKQKKMVHPSNRTSNGTKQLEPSNVKQERLSNSPLPQSSGDRKTSMEKRSRAVVVEEKKPHNKNYPNFACAVCDGNHSIYECTVFRKLTILKRIQSVESLRLCTICLKSKHRTPCTSRITCELCKRRHHSLLHDDNYRSHRQLLCPICWCMHNIADCSTFKAFSPARRIMEATYKNLCLVCLYSHNLTVRCRSLNKCENCGKSHHTLLHISKDEKHLYL